MDKVKWQDSAGGWHTGTVIPNAIHRDDAINIICGERQQMRRLVKESCCGTLTWVPLGVLSEWESREKWEATPNHERPWYFDKPSFTESKQ
jgi:hypothetical protein